MFTIRSISEDGEWYLMNHWNKYRSFWQKKDECTPDTVFKSVRTAKASLTKLLKVMPEYASDQFAMIEIKYDPSHYCYDFKEILW